MNIVNHVYDGKLIIFKESSDDFISRQYYREIASFSNLPIELVDNLEFSDDIFNVTKTLRIYKVDKLDSLPDTIINETNIIIICNSINKDLEKTYSDYLIKVPKLESWQIKDYVYSLCDGIREPDLDYLIQICNGNINRLQCEIDKIRAFNPAERQSQFNDFLTDNVFSDLTSNTIFDLTNSLTKKDKTQLVNVYKDLDNIDTGEMGFLSILYNGFKNIINIQLGLNPTAESCGLKPNQFWAIKNSTGKYSKEKLLDIFGYLSGLDKKIKLGEVDFSKIIDYTIIKIIGD